MVESDLSSRHIDPQLSFFTLHSDKICKYRVYTIVQIQKSDSLRIMNIKFLSNEESNEFIVCFKICVRLEKEKILSI